MTDPTWGPSTSRRINRPAAGVGPSRTSADWRGQTDDGPQVERLAEEMASEWRRGERPLAEEILGRHPEMADDPRALIRLVYEEYCLRLELDEPADRLEIARRFPGLEDQLRILFGCHSLVYPEAAAHRLPEPGETLGGFTLLDVVGSGAVGRVYLAAQPSLADRAVVLKVTDRSGGEHLSLARLQHTHIVPLHSLHDFPEKGLRALCMPYLGGASLQDVLSQLDGRPRAGLTGRDLLGALATTGVKLDDASPRGASRAMIGRMSYTQAVCWIGACLADALEYAHERGLVHLDIKPSNILITSEGQPLLLDFHLAREPIPRDSPPPRWLGGTHHYMSPEQAACLAAVSEGTSIPEAVDGRSDIYSLGMTLLVALTGRPRDDARGGPSRFPRRENPHVPRDVRAILGKCLARRPEDRYQDAASLKNDLRCHLSDLPLRGAPNRGLVERWRKWRRRRPHALRGAALAMVLLSVPALMAGVVWQQSLAGERGLVEGRKLIAARRFDEAGRVLRAAARAVGPIPASGTLRGSLEAAIQAAARGQLALKLHALAEQARLWEASGISDPDGAEVLKAGLGRLLKESPAYLGGQGGTLVDRGLEDQLVDDYRDLAIIVAHLEVRIAPEGRREEARHVALRALQQAEETFGPHFAIDCERRALAGRSAEADPTRWADWGAVRAEARTAWDHRALGRLLLAAGKAEAASEELAIARDLQFRDLWTHFNLGLCHFRLRRFEEALCDFGACVALEPEMPEAHENRGRALSALGRGDLARADLARAAALRAATRQTGGSSPASRPSRIDAASPTPAESGATRRTSPVDPPPGLARPTRHRRAM
jgi:serine/threonine protein kinase